MLEILSSFHVTKIFHFFGPWRRGGYRPRQREGSVPLVLGVSFGGAALRWRRRHIFSIKSPLFQPHLDGDVEKVLGVV
jgi:hypothetical protein